MKNSTFIMTLLLLVSYFTIFILIMEYISEVKHKSKVVVLKCSIYGKRKSDHYYSYKVYNIRDQKIRRFNLTDKYEVGDTIQLYLR